jgi:hypothetical protein
VVLTSEGMAAIGIAREGDGQMTAAAEADTAPTAAEADSAADTPTPASEADGVKKRSKGRPAKGKKARTTARATSEQEAAREPSPKPTPRAGTKQARMIELLKRRQGATVEQITAATGWQHHTISGALKKKLGLTVEATRTREVGPNKTGAKGSSTVYRITGSGPAVS